MEGGANQWISWWNQMLQIADLPGPWGGPLTLTVRPGEILGLFGPSGVGKTRLLELLSRVPPGVTWSQGRLDPRSPAHVWLLRDTSGPELPGVPVPTYMEAAAHAWRAPRGAVERTVERLGLPERLLSARADRLSQGARELLDLAILDLVDPKVALVDNPMAHLDALGLDCLRTWLDRRRSGDGVVLWAAGPWALGLLDRALVLYPDAPPEALEVGSGATAARIAEAAGTWAR